MEKIYLVFAEHYKEEELIYVGLDQNKAVNIYYACHDIDLDTNIDVNLSVKYSDSWIQVWENEKLLENEWRPTLEGIE